MLLHEIYSDSFMLLGKIMGTSFAPRPSAKLNSNSRLSIFYLIPAHQVITQTRSKCHSIKEHHFVKQHRQYGHCLGQRNRVLPVFQYRAVPVRGLQRDLVCSCATGHPS